ncbi:sugar porter family MFS transporter [Flavobacterium sp. N1994]|uniref:sugar porter family MFS transporter n=1 Tax=Flavobacterium sp. N1994 TaxID=2986827 RepID=UPI002222C10A|nr:sugar porter family MFS transporter [Flavobacterium sp. N1994]
MKTNKSSVQLYALIIAMGGLLMGFDASVISGVVKFIEPEFNLSKIELGWAVASLSLTATLAMMFAGPISDKLGRNVVLKYAALLYFFSAIISAVAPSFLILVIARLIAGIGVGMSLILAPMYIAEISPAENRGKMVSFNQLNIVIGISLAFFTNYLIVHLASSDAEWVHSLKIKEYNWRWMLGLEAIPALIYFICLFFVPQSPRWLIMKERYDEALLVLKKISDNESSEKMIAEIKSSILLDSKPKEKSTIKDLFLPSMKLVLSIGVVIAVLQQITGINSVFFYAPMIFEQSGIGTDTSFIQAILVGLINVVFTIIAIALIDKLGRKPLLTIGVIGVALSMFLLAYSFNDATYTLTKDSISKLPKEISVEKISLLQDKTFQSDTQFKNAISETLGIAVEKKYESELISASISMNAILILIGILGFVASFAISLGPVMWVLFSELFPNKIRGIAISFVGFINSAVSFIVQLVFPWELDKLGSTWTFLWYGIFALIGLLFILKLLPETKGKSLEELEAILVK